ncbi:MAG: hypothetical protein OXE56_10465, partial [Gammaproteobacteria bacterium]|nr:hypothetical protein [Gammaproteobacteria bacterium]
GNTTGFQTPENEKSMTYRRIWDKISRNLSIFQTSCGGRASTGFPRPGLHSRRRTWPRVIVYHWNSRTDSSYDDCK